MRSAYQHWPGRSRRGPHDRRASGRSPATTPPLRVEAVAVGGLAFGALQAASPLTFWWLHTATVAVIATEIVVSGPFHR
jgi:hypothetical protein